MVNFLLVLIELFSLAFTTEALLMRILVKMLVFERGMGHFKRKFQQEGGSSTNDSWRQKTRVPGLSRGVVCMILRLAVLIQYRRVTHRETDRETRDDG